MSPLRLGKQFFPKSFSKSFFSTYRRLFWKKQKSQKIKNCVIKNLRKFSKIFSKKVFVKSQGAEKTLSGWEQVSKLVETQHIELIVRWFQKNHYYSLFSIERDDLKKREIVSRKFMNSIKD